MAEVEPPPDAPEEVLYFVSGALQLMDSFLRLSGHPTLLAVAEAVYGPDFAPFSDAVWIKEPGLGSSVAWHQDGTTHWDNPGWDPHIHGLNFMAQLYGTSPVNALWVVPGSHRSGKIDIKRLIEREGTDRLPDAVPMLCQPGDVALCNRQVLHGSFPNTSSKKRVSLVFGAHRRTSVLDIKGWTHGLYDQTRVHQRSRVIGLAIDARSQHFRAEEPYVYQPLAGQEDANRWGPATRESVLRNYNSNDRKRGTNYRSCARAGAVAGEPGSEFEPGKAPERIDDGLEVVFGDELIVVESLNGIAGEDLVERSKFSKQSPAVFRF
jgi:hypothetical protein